MHVMRNRSIEKKRLRMWWCSARRELIREGMNPYDIRSDGWRIRWKFAGTGEWMTWGACIRDGEVMLYGDWTALVDKFYPSRCPFNFGSLREMIDEMKTISSLLLRSDLSLDKYIRKHNSAWVDDHEGRVDLMLHQDLANRMYNGLTREVWDELHQKRNEIIEEALEDESICAVVQVPDNIGFFGNIPNELWIVIEDDEDLISQRAWDAAWEKWSAIYDDTFRIQMRVVSRTDMMNYIYTNRPWGLRFFTGAIWRKGQRPPRHRR